MKEQLLKIVLRYVDNTKEANDLVSELLVLFDVSVSFGVYRGYKIAESIQGGFEISVWDGKEKHNGYILTKGKQLKDFKLQFAHLIDKASKTRQHGGSY
ncbi:MAG TPA: hypothetical protein PKL45_15370 [Bacteroidia bacterium]|nr:hypothetical protein [Bacteroidia bacterium]